MPPQNYPYQISTCVTSSLFKFYLSPAKWYHASSFMARLKTTQCKLSRDRKYLSFQAWHSKMWLIKVSVQFLIKCAVCSWKRTRKAPWIWLAKSSEIISQSYLETLENVLEQKFFFDVSSYVLKTTTTLMMLLLLFYHLTNKYSLKIE